jgi:hypothetical protein
VRPLAATLVVAAGLTVGAAGALACSVHAEVGPTIPGPSALAVLFPTEWSGVSAFDAVAPTVAPARPTALAGAPRPPRTAYRLRLVGHADPHEGYNADVWAHRGYAYLSSWGGPPCASDGVRIYDLTRPAHPVRIATFADAESDPALAGTWTEKTIVQHVATPAFSGELAVTSFQHCRDGAFRGWGLYDVSDPRAPRRLALVRTETRGSHEIWLQPRAGAAYVYTAIIDSETTTAPDFDAATHSARTPGLPDFRIYDVSNPAAPTEVGSWGAWRELGAYPHPDKGTDRFVHSVRANGAGTRAYLSYWDFGTVILDTTNPAAPRYLGRTPAAENTHSTALGRNGNLLLETHETDGGLPTFFDVSNPGSPRRLGELAIAAASRPAPAGTTVFMNGVHDPDVIGTRGFFSWYSQGVLAADIAHPEHPRVLAQFLPPPHTDPQERLCQSACRVVWGVALDRGYVLASDMLSGLYVLKLERRTT